MRKMRLLDEGSFIVIGTAREIQNVLRGLTPERGYYPRYLDRPKFNVDRMYAVQLDKDDHGWSYDWQIISADTVVRYLVAGILVEDYFTEEEYYGSN